MGLYQSTVNGQYLAATREMAKILGFESPEALVAATTDLSKEFYVRSGRRAELVEKIRQEGIASGFESQAYRKDGSIYWIRSGPADAPSCFGRRID